MSPALVAVSLLAVTALSACAPEAPATPRDQPVGRLAEARDLPGEPPQEAEAGPEGVGTTNLGRVVVRSGERTGSSRFLPGPQLRPPSASS